MSSGGKRRAPTKHTKEFSRGKSLTKQDASLGKMERTTMKLKEGSTLSLGRAEGTGEMRPSEEMSKMTLLLRVMKEG